MFLKQFLKNHIFPPNYPPFWTSLKHGLIPLTPPIALEQLEPSLHTVPVHLIAILPVLTFGIAKAKKKSPVSGLLSKKKRVGR